MKIKLTLDKRQVEYDAHPGEILIECLRRHGCFSVKRGCQDGNCGTCLVQINGQVVNSYLMLVAQADGAQIITAAGVGNLDN
ncbi:MAG TPA: 2Fe-2S iron-sulfur cluster binding domain-containing protein, partial [Myxococcales bacterium]|nr:2Fe-2S iron-sulfur cluster binding domain-containing protein [Myxococcales bacterium]